MTGDVPDYRSRDFDPNHHETYLRHLLDRLSALARDSNPTATSTAEDKDSRAFSALWTAGTLVDAVAGWAVDHVLGLSLAGEAMQALQPSGTKRHPEYLRYRQIADRHEPEGRGSAERFAIPASAAVRRLILRNYIFAGGVNLPPWLREEALQAFDALDRGEALPLVEPNRRRRGRGVRSRVAEVRMRLVAIARFRAEAYGGSIEEARCEVAACLGMEGESLKTWEQRLKRSQGIGSLAFDREISRAINAAAHVRIGRKPNSDPDQLERQRRMADHHEQRYGDSALAEAVAAWRQTEGT